jgi:predicted dienelactone hydrolase
MLAWLGEALARAGYLVAGVNHHSNTAAEDLPTPEGFMLWWERAVDLSRGLDRLLSDSQFGPLIDPDRIGAAGFSLGGYSVVAIAGGRVSLPQWNEFCASARRDSTCQAQPEFPGALIEFEKIRSRPDVLAALGHHGDSFLDPRFKAVFAIAPVGSWLTASSLSEVTVPVRIVVGAEDHTAPAESNAMRISDVVRDHNC